MSWVLFRLGLAGIGLCAAGAVPGAAAAQAPQDSSLIEIAAVRARLVAGRSERPVAASRPQRADPALTHYLAGIAQLGTHQFDSALVHLRAAVTASPTNARYHGDLAFALAGAGRMDEAADAYAAAARLQPGNPWYDVGLAAVRAKQTLWPQAKAGYDAALRADSSIIDRRLASAVSDCLDEGGFVPELTAWSRMASVRFSDDPMPWLRLATLLRHSDSAEGLAAVRRYRVLAPNERLGAALYANYLLGLGEDDSALVLAHEAAADTALWPYAWPVYLHVGGRLFQANALTQASQVLAQGRGIAPAARHAQFSLFLGYTNVQRLGPMYADAAQHKDCAKAHVVDSLEVSVRHDLAEGMAAGDSARINQIMTTLLPQARARINELLAQCPKS
jgi:tetratricopeptide (TPR) repeat protein